MVAPSGSRHRKADHPALSITTPEILKTARSCHAAGADALHLHIRDETGGHSLDAGRYRETLDALAHAAPDMRVQVSTEAAGVYDVPAQLACLTKLRPEQASISVREIARAPDLADRVYGGCAETGTEIQHILFDAGDIAILREWRARGIVRPDQSDVLFVLGQYGAGQLSSPAALGPFLSGTPENRHWMVCAFGRSEHRCLLAAARLGGTLRVGFENSLQRRDGTIWQHNADSVSALVHCLTAEAAVASKPQRAM